MKKLALLLSICALTFGSCKKEEKKVEPVIPEEKKSIADFKFDNDLNDAPKYIQFTNTSTDASVYSWDFGDGSTASEINPKHYYSKGGSYSVTLSASGNGPVSTKTKTLTISSKSYTRVVITKVLLNDIPYYNSSLDPWDPFSEPDIFYQITDETSTTLYNQGGTATDCKKTSLPLSWTLSTPLSLDRFKKIRLNFYDYDTPDPSDYMSGVIYDFSNETKFEPYTDFNSGGFNVRIYTNWE
jgi:PKD repeat protein